uniref:Uncharacterized protein n=1 Tax=viral metagenome TaxID=1070528 RepID=A0A6M3KPS8_9ZZZZ
MKISWKNTNLLADKIKAVIKSVEIKYGWNGVYTSAEKKKFALNILDGLINFPFPLNLFERQLLGLLVDLVIWIYNDTFGKFWLSKIDPKATNSRVIGE